MNKPRPGVRSHRFLLLLILLAAFALRMAAIDRLPPGLSHDEANNGITAIQVLEGQRRIFFEINKGIEPLIIYLEAAAFHFFGIGPVQLRLVNVMAGMLTVALIYPLAVRLFNRRVGLLAMAGLAVSFWAVFVSRLTLRAVLLPPLLLPTLYWLWRGLEAGTPQRKRSLYFALSGMAAGVGMYTYLAARFAPLLIGAIFGWRLIRRDGYLSQWAVGLLLHFAVWGTIFVPLGYYYISHADSFTHRYEQVTTIPHLRNGEFGPTLRNVGRTLGMFTFAGDRADRYNLAGRPLFDWLNGLIFYLGVVLLAIRLPGQPAMFLFLWAFFMLLPDFITDDSPHFLRTIGVMPLVYIVWAFGLSRLPELGGRLWPGRRRAAVLTAGLLVGLTAFHTAYDYFGRWANATEARAIYGADMAEIAAYLQSHPSQELTAISAAYYRDLDPFRLRLHFGDQPPFVLWFDGRQTLAFPPPESGLRPRYIFADSAPAAEIWSAILAFDPGESGRAYRLYHLPPDFSPPQIGQTFFPAEESRPAININDDLILTDYRLLGSVVSGKQFQLLLGWQALRSLPPGTDYTFVGQLQDADGHVWVQADGNGYQPANWQPGVRGLQLLKFNLPGDLPPRRYRLSLELVDRRRGEALPTAAGESTIWLAELNGQLAETPRAIPEERLPNPGYWPYPSDRPALALRGHQLYQAGESLTITLHWQTLRQPEQAYRYQFFLVSPQQEATYPWPPLEPVGGEWPTGQWPAGYWLQDKVTLPLAGLSGQFTLRGTLLDETSRPGPAFELGSFNVE